MPPAELRAAAHEVVDWIADYLEGVGHLPVLAPVQPGDVRGALPERAPVAGEPMGAILRDFRETILPGVTHWNHPGFLAYFAVTGSGPGILGEMLAAALNVNAMVWRTSPAGTELEELVMDWLRGLLGLPPAFRGVINDTASSSSLYALAAARATRLPESSEGGLGAAPPGRVYASAEAHSSIDKAVMTLGMGRRGIRAVEVDGELRMRPDALRRAVAADLDKGVRPVAVVATVGTTSTTSVDPVDAVADVAEENGMWLHVDAAYAGAAAAVPELRPLFRGWERADSIVMNPHKWLFTPMDCSALLFRSPDALRRAFALTPEYLRTREQGAATNLMDYGVSLGRRFRALKLWFVLRYFGSDGIADRIREHVKLAQEMAEWVDGASGWQRLVPVPFSTVVFRHVLPGASPAETDARNERILERLNAGGEVFLSHTRVGGRTALRLAIGNLRTTGVHMARVRELLQEAAEAEAGGGSPGPGAAGGAPGSPSSAGA